MNQEQSKSYYDLFMFSRGCVGVTYTWGLIGYAWLWFGETALQIAIR